MRLVIDLQAAQGASSTRGIGRYSRELALAMAREAREHEVIIALSGAFMRSAEELVTKFAGIVPRENIRVWHPPRDTSPLVHQTPLRPFAEALRAQFLASLQPDLVHVASLFDGWGDDVVNTQPHRFHSLPVVATCYDLIPMLHHADVLGSVDTPSPYARWYYRALQELSQCEGLLAISESSRGEAIDHLAYPAERIFNIRAGIGPEFRPMPLPVQERAALLQRYGLRDSFVMFLAAFSPIKNEEGLIAAYSMLPRELQARHQLLIAGERDRDALYRRAAELGIDANNLVYVPFIDERDLCALYTTCGVFVCPSRHEGFGLPPGEAMACGAPTIASNTTSLPEVIGREDATFDPEDPASIAACMRRVLEDPAFRRELAAYGPIQAGTFTWSASARRAWDALEAIHEQRTQRGATRVSSVLTKRPSLAFVSPLPPQASGIADYSADLLPSLARYYDITLVSELETSEPRLWAFPRLTPDAFLASAGTFDRVVYQIGNSPYHRYQTDDLLPRCPGTVVLHDSFLSSLMYWSANDRGRPDDFLVTLLKAHGYPALRVAATRGNDVTRQQFPCSLDVLQAAVGVIQHSYHGGAVLSQHFGEEATRDISVVPLARSRQKLPSRASARASLRLGDGELVVCSYGMLGHTKCPDLVAEAWRQADLPGRLVFVGDDGGMAPGLEGAAPRMHFTGRVTREEYGMWLAAADIAVQWRTDSRGETSAAVADALMAGLPLIVNRHGSAAELPESVVIGLPDQADASALASALVALASDAPGRATLAAAGGAYARREFAPDSVARRYFDTIEQAYATPRVAVVANSLQSDMEAVARLPEGVGVSARAIARSFRSPWRGGGRPRLLIDMSEVVRGAEDPTTARGVREIAQRALEFAPQGRRGEAVRLLDGRLRFTYAVPLEMLGLTPLALDETPMDVRPGDVLLCLDVNQKATLADFEELRRMRLDGLRVVVIIHDLSSILHSERLADDRTKPVAGWYGEMLRIADAAVCTSRAVADDLIALLTSEPGRRDRPLPVGTVALGPDVQNPTPPAQATSREPLATLAWDDSYRTLCDVVLSDQWDETWCPPGAASIEPVPTVESGVVAL